MALSLGGRSECRADALQSCTLPLCSVYKSRPLSTGNTQICTVRSCISTALVCLFECDPVRMRMLIVAVSMATDLPSAVKSTIEATQPSLLPTGTSPADFNASFLSRHSTSPAHILGAAAGLLEIKRASDPLPSNTSAEILAVLDKLFSEGVSPSIEVLQKGRSVLEEAGADKAELEAWRERCRTKLPLAWVFASKEEVEARKASEGPVPNGTVKADV